MKEEEHAQDKEPERKEERQPTRSSRSEQAAVILTLLIQFATLASEISELFR
ncbi:hypothetical protein [Lentzea sp. HUAS12]|uniref:hypothetical protein n=1 Tax=Lentzea sp. HUAS12 TaxID=2951806 RepID=UPI00209F6FCB|nr:hypothetical protein [Lentzea sp. HUAS12]USX56338.1 hypothetical protein ND450_20225 [Lentzea sp. HUAS12]